MCRIYNIEDHSYNVITPLHLTLSQAPVGWLIRLDEIPQEHAMRWAAW